jgi:hypothetical protein
MGGNEKLNTQIGSTSLWHYIPTTQKTNDI